MLAADMATAGSTIVGPCSYGGCGDECGGSGLRNTIACAGSGTVGGGSEEEQVQEDDRGEAVR